MPIGLREPLQLDGGHLLLLGLCGAKVSFVSPISERRSTGGPGISWSPPDWESQTLRESTVLYADIHGVSQDCCEALESDSRALILKLPSTGYAPSTCTFLSNEAPNSPPLIEGLLASIVFRDTKYSEQDPADNTSSVFLLLVVV